MEKYGEFNLNSIKEYIKKSYSPIPEFINLWIDEHNENAFAILKQSEQDIILLNINKELWDDNKPLEFQEIVFWNDDFAKVQETPIIKEFSSKIILNFADYLEFLNEQAHKDIRIVNKLRKLSHLQLEKISLAFLDFIVSFDLPDAFEDFSLKRGEFLKLMARKEKQK